MDTPHKRTPPGAGAALRSISDQADERRTHRLTATSVESGLSTGELAVLQRIREAARAGAPAPTTDEIAELLDCSSLSTPIAALRRLQLRGLIYFESFQRGRRFWLPDGRSTAPVACNRPPWRWIDREAANG